MSRFPGVDYYFYKADPTLSTEAVMDDHTITVRCRESLDTVWEKFVKTLTFLNDRLGSYDFILRPNLSSFFFIDRYLKAAERWARQNFCSAFVGWHGNISFPSGSGFTISTDIARRIVVEKPATVFVDDVSLGACLQKWGIPIIQVGRYCGSHIVNGNSIPPTVFHVRIKTANRDDDVRLHTMLAHLQCDGANTPL